MRIIALLMPVSLHILLSHVLHAGVATTDVEAALMSRSMCDGQGLLGLTADSLVALQLPTPALRLLHSSLDALRSVSAAAAAADTTALGGYCSRKEEP